MSGRDQSALEHWAKKLDEESQEHPESWKHNVKEMKWDTSRIDILNGRAMTHMSFVLSATWVDQMRTGYRCMPPCCERFQSAWPKTCVVCNRNIDGDQQQRFEDEFQGTQWVGPTVDIADELDRLDEDTHPRNWHEPDSQILVPKIWTPGDAP